MFDIGIGEIAILAVIGLLVFGPEKLPKAAADAARMLRQVRGMAANARKDLADSAGVDFTEAIDSVRGLSDLHPRKLAAGFLSDDDASPSATRAPGSTPTDRPGPRFDPDAT